MTRISTGWREWMAVPIRPLLLRTAMPKPGGAGVAWRKRAERPSIDAGPASAATGRLAQACESVEATQMAHTGLT